MIFLTVGTQLAFPRLTRALNDYASGRDEEVIAQVGGETGDLPNLDVRQMLAPNEFVEIFTRARVVVGHAGIGTILSAKRYRRPLVIVPRRHALGEHRNDHQVATARALEDVEGLHIAWDIADLPGLLNRADLAASGDGLGPRHSELVDGLRRFIAGIDADLRPGSVSAPTGSVRPSPRPGSRDAAASLRGEPQGWRTR